MIGPLEQLYLKIGVTMAEAAAGNFSHVELKPTNML
jgi:hypothetical protein